MVKKEGESTIMPERENAPKNKRILSHSRLSTESFSLARARSSPSSMSSQAVAHNYRRGRWTEAGARRHGENARSCYAPMKLFPLDLVLRPLFKIISDFVLM